MLQMYSTKCSHSHLHLPNLCCSKYVWWYKFFMDYFKCMLHLTDQPTDPPWYTVFLEQLIKISLVWDPKVYLPVHKSPPLDLILSHFILVHIFTTCLRFILILFFPLLVSFFKVFQSIFHMHFLFLYACYISHLPQTSK